MVLASRVITGGMGLLGLGDDGGLYEGQEMVYKTRRGSRLVGTSSRDTLFWWTIRRTKVGDRVAHGLDHKRSWPKHTIRSPCTDQRTATYGHGQRSTYLARDSHGHRFVDETFYLLA